MIETALYIGSLLMMAAVIVGRIMDRSAAAVEALKDIPGEDPGV